MWHARGLYFHLEQSGGTGKWNSHKYSTSALRRCFRGSGAMSASRTCRFPCHSLRGRARLQAARPAGAFRQLAHRLHAHEPVVEERRPGPRFRAPAAGADDPDPGRGPESRQHQHRVHPDGTGAPEKTARSASASPGAGGPPGFIWLPRMPGQPWPSHSPPATRTTPRRGGSS